MEDGDEVVLNPAIFDPPSSMLLVKLPVLPNGVSWIGTNFIDVETDCMASPSAGTNLSDTLSKLRIQRSEPRRSGSWTGRLLKLTLVLAVLLVVAAGGFLLARANGWISSAKSWAAMPEIMQSRTECRMATVTAETGRSADATVVATGYLES